jgi:hypothetical protein
MRSGLDIDVVDGPALRCLVCLHVALNGDDGSAPGRVSAQARRPRGRVRAARKSELAKRFPHGHWRIEPSSETTIVEEVAGDERLFADGADPRAAVPAAADRGARALRFAIVGRFVTEGPDVPEADRPDAPSERLAAET